VVLLFMSRRGRVGIVMNNKGDTPSYVLVFQDAVILIKLVGVYPWCNLGVVNSALAMLAFCGAGQTNVSSFNPIY